MARRIALVAPQAAVEMRELCVLPENVAGLLDPAPDYVIDAIDTVSFKLVLIERAKKEISLAKDKAVTELKAEVVYLSTEIAAKLIAKNLNPNDQKAFIEDALAKIRTVQ
mgnify:CR=1 FL=1